MNTEITFNKTDPNKAPHLKLIDYINDHKIKRGRLFLHSDIEKITGVSKKHKTQYYATIRKANDVLTPKRLRLGSYHHEGYRLLKLEEYEDEALKKFRIGHTYIDQAKFIIDSVDVDDLPRDHDITTAIAKYQIKTISDAFKKLDKE